VTIDVDPHVVWYEDDEEWSCRISCVDFVLFFSIPNLLIWE
jgi:hypothetical protein